MTDLRTAAQQALEALEQSETTVPYEGFGMARREAERKHQAAITALKDALEQEQAEQTWVCPDSPEHRYKMPGHCEDCGRTLVLAQEQGCDHCRHPLYAATRCRVCGRVTEQAELARHFCERCGKRLSLDGVHTCTPPQQAEPVQEPVAKVELMTTGGNAGLATRIVEIDDHLRERLRPGQLLYTAPTQRKLEPVQQPAGWLESPHGAFRADPLYKMQFPSKLLHWQIALYTAPPQRSPLTDEEIIDATEHIDTSRDGYFIDIARAVERALEEKNNAKV